VADLLRELGYSLQANRKAREGTSHPDRDAQFGYINQQVKQALAAHEPAISNHVDYARRPRGLSLEPPEQMLTRPCRRRSSRISGDPIS
jgi:hypothetical protein